MQTKIINFWIALIFCTLPVSSVSYGDELDETLNEALRTACHGNLLDKDAGSLSKYIYENSPLCKDLENNYKNNIDDNEGSKKYNSRLVQQDLERIYNEDYFDPLAPTSIEIECTVEIMGEQSGVDGLCKRTRESLAAKNIPMSQKEYEKIAKGCNNNRECIEATVDKWSRYIENLSTLKDQKTDKNSFDYLMDNAKKRSDIVPFKKALTVSFDTLMERQTNELIGGDVDFDKIHTGREKIRINEIKKTLFTLGENIASRCQCSFNKSSCFSDYHFGYEQLNKVLAQTDKKFESQQSKICTSWNKNISGKTSDTETLLNNYIKNSNAIISNLDILASKFESINANLLGRERAIDEARTSQDQGKGFNWGKFTALSVGTLIGASGSNISGEALIKVMGTVAMDSMDGVEGIDNFQKGLGEITQVNMDHNDKMVNIQIEKDKINTRLLSSSPMFEQPTDTTTGVRIPSRDIESPMFEPIEQVVQKSEAVPIHKSQSGLCTPSGITGYPKNNIYWDGNSLSCSDGVSPSIGRGYWNYLECRSATKRVEVSACQGESARLAGYAACAYRTQKASKVLCECTYSEKKHAESYCINQANQYLQ